MEREANTSNSFQIVREAVDALMRCDGVQLEELVCICEGWLGDLRPGLDRQSFNFNGLDYVEFGILARLLEFTNENMRIIRSPRRVSSTPLEYVPIAGCCGSEVGD